MNQYQPDFVTPPSMTLLETIRERRLSWYEFAHSVGLTIDDAGMLLGNILPITPALAARFEELLGVPAAFWLERERQYREWRVANGQT